MKKSKNVSTQDIKSMMDKIKVESSKKRKKNEMYILINKVMSTKKRNHKRGERL